MDKLNGNPLSDYTNEELFELYFSTNSIEVKQEIALRYVYVVKSIAVQMRNVYIGFENIEDIINEGVIVLMKAIDKFEMDKQVKFETYISKRIRGMIIDIARKQDWVPRTLRKAYNDICEVSHEFYIKNGREPKFEEISGKLSIDKEKYNDIVKKSTLFSVLSLDLLIEEVGERKKVVQVPSERLCEQPESEFLKNELKDLLEKGILSLRKKEQLVIALYYLEELNMKEIAKVLEISEPRVSQIHTSAIKKLKDYLKDSNGVKKEAYYVSGLL